jgi:hypothetical protein
MVSSSSRFVGIVLGLVVACGSLPDTGFAQSTEETSVDMESELDDTGQSYNGAFFEPSLRLGWTRSDAEDVRGWNFDVGLRYATLLSVGDLRVAYRMDGIRPTSGEGERTFLHTFGGWLALHPLALFVFGSDWLPYTLSSLYFEIGGGARGTNLSEPPGTEESLKAAPVWSVGVGIDVPLGDPDGGLLPWLHVLYRYNRGEFPGSRPSRPLELHAIFAGIGIRANGSLL